MECFPQSGWCDGREDCVKGEDEAVCAMMVTSCQVHDGIVDDFIKLRRRPPPAVLHFEAYGTLHVTDMSDEIASKKKV